jgi:hypothetical protein
VAAREADREPQRDEALLCAVVEALERAALAVGGSDDPLARRAELR